MTGKNRRSQSPAQTPQRRIDPSPWRPPAPPAGPLLTVIDPLAADRPGVRHSEDHARPGDEPKAFNGRNTQTSGLPGLRPVAPSLRSGNGSPPHGGRWCAARTVTRATLGTCSVLDRRPRSATSKAQAVPPAPPARCSPGLRRRNAGGIPSARRYPRQISSGRLHGRGHP